MHRAFFKIICYIGLLRRRGTRSVAARQRTGKVQLGRVAVTEGRKLSCALCPLMSVFCCKTPILAVSAQDMNLKRTPDDSLLRQRAILRIKILSKTPQNSFATVSGVKRKSIRHSAISVQGKSGDRWSPIEQVRIAKIEDLLVYPGIYILVSAFVRSLCHWGLRLDSGLRPLDPQKGTRTREIRVSHR